MACPINGGCHVVHGNRHPVWMGNILQYHQTISHWWWFLLVFASEKNNLCWHTLSFWGSPFCPNKTIGWIKQLGFLSCLLLFLANQRMTHFFVSLAFSKELKKAISTIYRHWRSQYELRNPYLKKVTSVHTGFKLESSRPKYQSKIHSSQSTSKDSWQCRSSEQMAIL